VTGVKTKTQQSIAAGPFVAIRWEAKGSTAGGEGVEPVEITLHGAHVFTLTDDRISAVEAYTSDMEYLEKTGLIAKSATGESDALGPRGRVAEDAGTPAAAAPPPATPKEKIR
jgi:hypothetical protein